MSIVSPYTWTFWPFRCDSISIRSGLAISSPIFSTLSLMSPSLMRELVLFDLADAVGDHQYLGFGHFLVEVDVADGLQNRLVDVGAPAAGGRVEYLLDEAGKVLLLFDLDEVARPSNRRGGKKSSPWLLYFLLRNSAMMHLE